MRQKLSELPGSGLALIGGQPLNDLPVRWLTRNRLIGDKVEKPIESTCNGAEGRESHGSPCADLSQQARFDLERPGGPAIAREAEDGFVCCQIDIEIAAPPPMRQGSMGPSSTSGRWLRRASRRAGGTSEFTGGLQRSRAACPGGAAF